MARGGHRPEPDLHRRRLAPGTGPQGREPVPRRTGPGEPRGPGGGHRPGAAGPLPGLCLSGRVPCPVLRARPLGHGLRRPRDLRRQGAVHRRRRPAGHPAGERPTGGSALQPFPHTRYGKGCFCVKIHPVLRLPAPRCPRLPGSAAGRRTGRLSAPCSRCTG